MRTVPAIGITAGLVLLASACGGSPATTSAGSTQLKSALAFAHCMRSHGVPSFPDPDAQGDLPTFHTDVSKQVSSAANDTCKHLLSTGGAAATPQQRQQKLAFGVKVAECLRAHGYANVPDPTALGSQSLPPGVDVNAPKFQAAETTCERKAKEALGLP